MNLEKLYTVLSGVIKNKVFYGINIYDNNEIVKMPFIVYKEISKRNVLYSDNQPLIKRSNIQITLVTKHKDIYLENKLEKSLDESGFFNALLSEYQNEDKSVNRVYEIYMEEIKNGRK